MPAKPLDVLIAVAHANELGGLQHALGSTGSARLHGLLVAAGVVGVGMPAAAIGTMQRLSSVRPRAVVLLGSCGVYRAAAKAELLTPAIPHTLQLTDAAVVAGRAAHPEPMPVRANVHRELGRGLARAIPNALRGALATTSGITTSDALAKRLARDSGCVVENLEALAVALACEAHAVPFATLLVITNVVGSRGRRQWLEQHRAAAVSGGAWLLKWLEHGAPGLPARRSRY